MQNSLTKLTTGLFRTETQYSLEKANFCEAYCFKFLQQFKKERLWNYRRIKAAYPNLIGISF